MMEMSKEKSKERLSGEFTYKSLFEAGELRIRSNMGIEQILKQPTWLGIPVTEMNMVRPRRENARGKNVIICIPRIFYRNKKEVEASTGCGKGMGRMGIRAWKREVKKKR